jgi:hypothetical protein
MASWQAHVMDAFMRVGVKPRLAGKTDLARARAILGSGTLPVPSGAVYREATLNGVRGEKAAWRRLFHRFCARPSADHNELCEGRL